MTPVHPLFAIVRERLRRERRLVVSACAASAVAGTIQTHVVAPPIGNPFAAEIATRAAWVAGPMLFGTILAVIVAVVQRNAGRFRDLEFCEQSAPIYGRDLARATALVPCVVVTLAALVYWAAQFVTGLAAPPAFFVLVIAAVNATTLVTLSATLRRGFARYLYIVLGASVGLISFFLATYADALRFQPVENHYPDVLGIAGALTFCIFIGFVALRQYGETLARYDPVPE
jgi:hypothetical protein